MPIDWKRRKFTPEQLTKAVEDSLSWRQVAIALELNPSGGGTYYGLKQAAGELELDTAHFHGKGWNKGDKFGLAKRNTTPLNEILIEDSSYLNTHYLKIRLIKDGLLVAECSAPFCPVPSPSVNPFTGEECDLKLSLDHINGVRTDNRIENLRLLCYHCHGMTDTYAGSNNRKE